MTLLIIFGAVFLLILIVVWAIYNGLVRANNVVEEAYSGIDVQLKKRYELIPNLIEAVKGYNFHEASVLENLVEKRAGKSNSFGETMRDDQSITHTLKTFRIQIEAYPDLQANAQFLILMDALSIIENELSMARRYFNGTTRDFNNKVEVFPNVLFAKKLGYSKKEFYEINENEKIVPAVNLNED